MLGLLHMQFSITYITENKFKESFDKALKASIDEKLEWLIISYMHTGFGRNIRIIRDHVGKQQNK